MARHKRSGKGEDEVYYRRLRSSLFDAYHGMPRWDRESPPPYDGPAIGENFMEVTHISEPPADGSLPTDIFSPILLHGDSATSVPAVHTDLFKLAQSHRLSINRLHSFMCFPPTRAIVRSLVIELEGPNGDAPGAFVRPAAEALPNKSVLLDSLWDSYDEGILTDCHRLARLNVRTRLDGFSTDRCFHDCVCKLFTVHALGDQPWDFGGDDVGQLFEVLIAVVALFLDALASARASVPGVPLEPPEDWFEWIINNDPWIREPDDYDVVGPDPPRAGPIHGAPSQGAPGLLVGQVSEEGDQGRVTVTWGDDPEERFIFENILDSRWRRRGGSSMLLYLIQWKNGETTWEPSMNLEGCDEWMWRFHGANPEKAGPPRWLQELNDG